MTPTGRVSSLPHHRVHDSRHFYAIRAIRAGTPYELVARQLGHADIAMVAKVYGRFAPRSDERDRWEKIAAAQDKNRGKWVPWWVPHPTRLTMQKRGSRWLRALWRIAGEGLEPSTPAL